MNIFYVFTVLLLFITFILFKKSNNKLNLLTWIVYTVALFFCYNIFITYLNYYLKIPSTLFNLGIINIIVSFIIFFTGIFKKKKIIFQKYYVKKIESVCLILITIICFTVGYIRFNGFTTITYETTTDAAVHYRMTMDFVENNSLLNKDNSAHELYGNFDTVMTGSYVNSGIFIQVFNFMPSYFAFILFDVLIFIIGASLFFVTGLEIIKISKKNLLVLGILTILYVMGYPLNNLVFGFYYLGIGVLIINLLLLTINIFEKEKITNNYLKIIIIFLINMGLFFSYYLFIPAIYLALGLYYIYKWKKKEITFKQMILYGSTTLIIPFIIGMLYFIIPGFIGSSTSFNNQMKLEGYIYGNFSGNIILYLPILLSSLVFYKKKKKIDFDLVSFIIMFIYIIFMIILLIMDKISAYYFFKLYYPFWLLSFIIVLKALLFNDKESLKVLNIVIGVIIVVFLVACTSLDKLANLKRDKFELIYLTDGVVNVYTWNINRFRQDIDMLNTKEIELINESTKYNDKCVVNKEFLITGFRNKNFWYYSLTDNVPIYRHKKGNSDQLNNDTIGYYYWQKDNDLKCLIYFYKEFNTYTLTDEELKKYNILYENDEGIIIEKEGQ